MNGENVKDIIGLLNYLHKDTSHKCISIIMHSMYTTSLAYNLCWTF